MKFIKTDITEVVIIEPRLFKDDRGCFYEVFSFEKFDQNIGEIAFYK